MKNMLKKGKFITFEGSEGCGKSTQSQLLKTYLENKGFAVMHLREPGGTEISEEIRKILLDAKNKSMVSECEMLLYMAARAQVVGEVIAPALRKGVIVISDRFLDSTLAYQGYGLGMSIDLIKNIGGFVSRGITPDLTILLDVPVKKGLGYRAAAKDRIEQRPLAYHTRVRKGYFHLARLQPERIKIVKVQEDTSVTQNKIRELVAACVGASNK
jgi:dTMP kinase